MPWNLARSSKGPRGVTQPPSCLPILTTVKVPLKLHAITLATAVIVGSATVASSASLGPVTCRSMSGTLVMRDCAAKTTEDGGGFGRCTIITTGSDGKRIVTKIDVRLRPWGGVHPIQKPQRSLQLTYRGDKFVCSFTPSAGYTVGDCVVRSDGGTCTVVKTTNGSNRYFKASATARSD